MMNAQLRLTAGARPAIVSLLDDGAHFFYLFFCPSLSLSFFPSSSRYEARHLADHGPIRDRHF